MNGCLQRLLGVNAETVGFLEAAFRVLWDLDVCKFGADCVEVEDGIDMVYKPIRCTLL